MQTIHAVMSLPMRSLLTLQGALDALTAWNRLYLSENPSTPKLYAAGVRYRREPISQERWYPVPELLAQGFGDCEDLASWRAAEVPGARAIARRVRGGWHVVVQLPDGKIEDPSKRLGMNARAEL